MELAVQEINAKGGILGRPAKLIIEDSTSGDAGVAVQKAHKLIDRDKVNFLIGNVNSGLTEAISQVAHATGVFMMDPGGHADPIKGTDRKAVGEVKSVSRLVDLGGRRIIKKKS